MLTRSIKSTKFLWFQGLPINSIYLKKNKIISVIQDRKNFSYPKFIKNFLSLNDKEINFIKIDKKSTFNTAKYLINYFKKLI